MSRSRPQRAEVVMLLLILSFGLLLRLLALAAFHHIPRSDEIAYETMALNLVSGKGIVDNFGNYAFYNMGYPFFILAPVFAIFGKKLLAARIVNIVLGELTMILAYATAGEAGAGRSGRLLAAAIGALYLPASIYAVYIAKENLTTPIMLGIVWCALRLAQRPGYPVAIGCGLLFGLIALTGNAGLCLAAPVAFGLMFASANAWRKLRLSVVVLISAVVVAAPWMMRNAWVLGYPVLNTDGGFNLYLGNNQYATGYYMSISNTPRGPTWHRLLKTAGELSASNTLQREAIAWIASHPTAFLELSMKKAIYFWEPPFHEGTSQVSWYEPVIRLIWTIQYIALLVGALGTLAAPSPRDVRIAVLWLALASYTSVFMVFYVIGRYREPIMPVLWVMAAIAVEAAYRHWRPRDARARSSPPDFPGTAEVGRKAGRFLAVRRQQR